jgi:hypothetical protein
MKCYWAEIRDIDDPTQSGHCRVRLYNKQNNEKESPDDKLAWGVPMQPITSAATAGVGIIPSGMIVGSRVLVGFTEDDTSQQYPIILGTFGRAKLPSKGGVRSDPDEESGGKIAEEDASPDSPTGPRALA